MTTLGLRDLGFLGSGLRGVPDPNFASVSLLLHGDGINGSTTITDSSSSPKMVTAFSGAQIRTAQSRFGGSSIFIPGGEINAADSRLESASNSAFQFGSGDFTIEFWMYASAQSLGAILAHTSIPWVNSNNYDSQGWVVFVYDNGLVTNVTRKLTFMLNGATFALTTSDAFSDNTWTYIGITKQGTGSNNIKMVSGTSGATTTIATGTYATAISSATSPLMVGATINGVNWNTTYPFDGYLDDIRITKGVARDISTVPTAPFPDF